jgi:hypothetical protein
LYDIRQEYILSITEALNRSSLDGPRNRGCLPISSKDKEYGPYNSSTRSA